MNTSLQLETLKIHEITGAVAILAGHGKLPRLKVTTPASTAEIYLHGAHVTAFQKNGEPPLLFMSAASNFAPGKPIRGGIPICFPWFGPKNAGPAHGFARLNEWQLAATSAAPDGRVTVRFRLPAKAGEPDYCGNVEYVVSVGDTLNLELEVTNQSPENLTFEECLHTYFTVGDIGAVTIRGLHGVNYLDKVGGLSRKTETGDAISINSEVDRVYLDTTHAVEVVDTKLKRTIRVDKSGSASTVIWNPWVVKSKAMTDFGETEYHRMVCVESGNVGQSKTTLMPGTANKMKVAISCRLD